MLTLSTSHRKIQTMKKLSTFDKMFLDKITKTFCNGDNEPVVYEINKKYCVIAILKKSNKQLSVVFELETTIDDYSYTALLSEHELQSDTADILVESLKRAYMSFRRFLKTQGYTF